MTQSPAPPGACAASRVLIVEDHPIFRMGMTDLINQEKDLKVCGHADDVTTARTALGNLSPDMVIVDITLKASNGLELVKEIHDRDRHLPVLVLSMHDEALYARRALRAGARGYIMKEEASDAVVSAIRKILAGGTWVSDRVMGSLLDQVRQCGSAASQPPRDQLTDRELEVFELIGRGFSTGRIAKQLNLSAKTVGTYRDRIKLKLGLDTSADLTRRAVLWVEKERPAP